MDTTPTNRNSAKLWGVICVIMHISKIRSLLCHPGVTMCHMTVTMTNMTVTVTNMTITMTVTMTKMTDQHDCDCDTMTVSMTNATFYDRCYYVQHECCYSYTMYISNFFMHVQCVYYVYVTVHEKIDHNAGIIYFYLAPGMLSMTLSALTVQVWWL